MSELSSVASVNEDLSRPFYEFDSLVDIELKNGALSEKGSSTERYFDLNAGEWVKIVTEISEACVRQSAAF